MLRLVPLLAAFLSQLSLVNAALPSKIYGVNLGSWLVLEPWMLPSKWKSMGGQDCSVCSTCIRSEFELVKAYPNTADNIFEDHWNSWFTQDDVDRLVKLGINTVRIPLGYWIIEPLVDRSTEFYPRGGLKVLKRGLQQLSRSGIAVILDHHALPGVQSPEQMFTGRCTTDVQFYTRYNYDRALVWTALMTVLSHVDPDFASVAAIEAVNEPIMDASLTPGYGDFQKDFVEVIRGVEYILGIRSSKRKIRRGRLIDISAALADDAALMVPGIGNAFSIDALTESFDIQNSRREALITTFMDINWQYSNPANPRDARNGPQIYDNHLYYNFGGVADPNENAYMRHICHLDRIENDAALGNSPLVFGEWGLPTNFPATDTFLRKWADAQKRAYSRGAGWIFWNFKIEKSVAAGDLARQWSYFEGVERGYLTNDPAALNDPQVCDPYLE